MEKRPLGATGLMVTPLGFGGAEIGFQEVAPDQVASLLNGALDAGLNVIDTAECYRESETLIGDAVSHRRSEYVLFTKCGHASGIDLPDWDPKLIELQIDRSLKRLKTDHVDLLQLHSCSEEMLRRGEVIEAVERIKAAGKARFVGYSGDNEAALFAVQSGRFDTLQTSISVADQWAIDYSLPAARAANMGVIVKRPIANAVWRSADPPVSDYHRPYWDRILKLKYAFLDAPLAESISIAMRFTLGLEGVSTAIVGTSKPGRWAENAALLEAGPLDEAIVAAIRSRWAEAVEPDWTGQI